MEWEWLSRSPEATAALGHRIGERLWPGSFVALVGDLGAGKTALAQGILAGLGVERSGGSPTFPLLWEYRGGRLPVYHWDVYRIRGLWELEELGYEDSFYGDGVCLVEWADKVEALWPPEHLRIDLEPVPEGRRVRLTARGARYEALLEELRHADPGL
ncbi:MAG: tRNA (adenosine(37)-N6)-threonylcarbamoyltransferase complex ATPase subunit type 1 TsaE [Firmicutes bacterium]|nr:tRNA (adenosine(37)-N6)-threonylcarbamoyltransferase complex ATPase subunit type 1 TsaE [Bacillota bacterium]